MADELAEMGVERWVLQPFRVEGCADAALVAAGPAALRVPETLEAHAISITRARLGRSGRARGATAATCAAGARAPASARLAAFTTEQASFGARERASASGE